MRSNVTIEEIWKEQVGRVFPLVPEDHSGGGLANMHKYQEEKVDKMRL
jgi:hypothetical protein